MRHYILYGHGGSGNHGCEALVRTTANLFDYPNNQITLISHRPEEDYYYGIDQLCQVIANGTHTGRLRKNGNFWKAYFALKIKHDYSAMDNEAELQAIKAKKGDFALSIGGDAYCYGEKDRNELIRMHRLFKEAGIKTVFWGCSIEPRLLDNKEILEDIESFDLITARESISYNALKKVNPNTVLMADSAFTLKADTAAVSNPWMEKELIGINASPLIERAGAQNGLVRKNYEKLIENILDETHYSIVFIPHVIWKHDDDREVLNELYSKYSSSGRVYCYGDADCNEIKGVISCCKFFIGARTHASIAAYSKCIPTIVTGYSTKSRGIATDLLGDYKDFVIPVQELSTEEDLTEAWKWLQHQEQTIRVKLKETIPQYIQRVYDGQKAVLRL
jgi:polysaccharide pyruvyl transferase WcaK-like protein